MKLHTISHYVVLLLLACLINTIALADTTFIKFGAAWKYLDKGIAAAIGHGAADWRSKTFNDAAWKTGPAELGYGENKERTTVSFGGNPANKYITTYFRRLVNIPAITRYSTIRLNAYVDDGAVIYVNGKEVARANITGSPVFLHWLPIQQIIAMPLPFLIFR